MSWFEVAVEFARMRVYNLARLLPEDTMSSTADLVWVFVWLFILAVLSVYKLVMIYRSRKDPTKHEWYLNQPAVFPEKIMRLIEDARYDEKHPESAPGTKPRKRSIWLF